MSIADKLQSTRLEYRFEDASGYRFTVTCEKEQGRGPDGEVYERGWSARVEMTTRGLISPEAAIDSLIFDAKDFIRQAKAARKDGARDE